MAKLRTRLNVCTLCLLSAVLCLAAPAQTHNAKLRIRTQQCEEGRVLHPAHVSVVVLDASKIPEIIKTNQQLEAALSELNSDPNAAQKAETLYGQLQNQTSKARALARITSLPKSEYVVEIQPVKSVIVFAFERSESDSFTFATKELDPSPNQVSDVLLNFSSADECADAK